MPTLSRRSPGPWEYVTYHWEVAYPFCNRRNVFGREVIERAEDAFPPNLLEQIFQTVNEDIDWQKSCAVPLPSLGWYGLRFKDGSTATVAMPPHAHSLKQHVYDTTMVTLYRHELGRDTVLAFRKTLSEVMFDITRKRVQDAFPVEKEKAKPVFEPFKDNPVIWEDLTL